MRPASQAWTPRERLAIALSLLPGAAFQVAFVDRAGQGTFGNVQHTLFDDAMIAMSYGRTLARTGEWVWFPGAERVQGFTNLLYAAYMALLHRIGLEGSSAALAVSLSGMVFLLAAGVVAAVIVREASPGSPAAFPFAMAAAFTVPLLYPVAFWTLRGMEVGLLALLALAVALAVNRLPDAMREGAPVGGSLARAALAAVVGTLTRIDFAMIALVLAAWAFLWAPGTRRRAQVALGLAVPVLLTVGAVVLFQWWYWGDPLPNTYRLKVQGYDTLALLRAGLASLSNPAPFLLLLAVAALAALRQATPRARRTVASLTSVVLAVVAYSVRVGGDAWEWALLSNRYVSVVMPAGAVAILLGAQAWREGGSRAAVAAPTAASGPGLGLRRSGVAAGIAAALAVLLATSAVPVARWWGVEPGPHVQDDQVMTMRGRQLAWVTTPAARIAVTWAGAPSYWSRRPMVDLLGKSDRRVAGVAARGEVHPGHNKWDTVHSIGELRPDVIFQLHRVTDEERRQVLGWGYVTRCEPLLGEALFLSGSPNVRWERLPECAPRSR